MANALAWSRNLGQTQVEGLRKRITEIAAVFNGSPLAKCKNLAFNPDDFAYRLIGTGGDHAADQKKSHELLREWKVDTAFQRLGEEPLFAMPAMRAVAYLLPLKGGHVSWDELDDEAKANAYAKIIREIGKDVFEALPSDEQQKLTRRIRTGCCMHKELSTVNGGDRAMRNFWTTRPTAHQPIPLANRDNSAVLRLGASTNTTGSLTTAERRAAEVLKRGGSHATLLAIQHCYLSLSHRYPTYAGRWQRWALIYLNW